MEDTYTDRESHESHVRRQGILMSGVESVYDFIMRSLRTIAAESSLFIGVALTLIGLLSFHSDKFCDGNSADYLSCTRPSTFYFYSPLEIAMIVLGVFLIMLWVLHRRRA